VRPPATIRLTLSEEEALALYKIADLSDSGPGFPLASARQDNRAIYPVLTALKNTLAEAGVFSSAAVA